MTPEHVKTTIAALHASYRYKADGGLQSWRFMRPDAKGLHHGDCEDFVLTAMADAFGSRWAALRAIMAGDARLYRTHHNGGPHIVGEIDATAENSKAVALRFDNSGRVLPREEFMQLEGYTVWEPLSRWTVLFQVVRLWIAGALFGGAALGLLAWAW